MSDPSGWLWVIIAVLGIGGLGLGIAYGSNMWLRRGSIARQVQDATVRENYREEEIREKSLENPPQAGTGAPASLTSTESIQGTSNKDTTKSRGAVTGHNVRYVLVFGLAGTIIAFVIIAIFSGF